MGSEMNAAVAAIFDMLQEWTVEKAAMRERFVGFDQLINHGVIGRDDVGEAAAELRRICDGMGAVLSPEAAPRRPLNKGEPRGSGELMKEHLNALGIFVDQVDRGVVGRDQLLKLREVSEWERRSRHACIHRTQGAWLP